MLKLFNLQYRGQDVGSERGYYYEFSNDPSGRPIVEVILSEHVGDHLVVFMANGKIERR